MPLFRHVEWIVLVYLAYVVIVAWARPRSARARVVVSVGAVLDAGGVFLLASAATPLALVARDWAPALHVLVGYWLSGALFDRPMPAVERWLVATDAWVGRRLNARDLHRRTPRVVLEILEFAYASVTPMLPIGFAVVEMWAPSPDADRYWTAVAAAELGCYGCLPWLQTRPPTSTTDTSEVDARVITFRALNRAVLARVSIQVNTLPSGHAAGAVASALAVSAQLPAAGPLFLIWAALIVAGSVIGRYHYIADAVTGVALAIAIAGVVGLR